MYTIDDLNVRLLSELKDIAEGMGVKNAKKLAKQAPDPTTVKSGVGP